MAQGVSYKHTRKTGPFLAGELREGQVGVDTVNKFLYFSSDGTTVVKHRPVSDAEFAAIGAAIPSSEKGAANGVATLDAGGKVPSSQLPALSLTDVSVVASQAQQLSLTAEEGDVAIRTDQGGIAYVHNGGVAGTMADWTDISGPAGASGVTTFNSRTGSVSPQAGDYTTDLVTRTDGGSGVSGATTEAAISSLKGLVDGKAASSHSHPASDVTSGDLAAARMQTNLAAALNATSGTISNANLIIDGGTL